MAHKGDEFLGAWRKQARAQGWTVEITRAQHVRFTRPDGRKMQVSLTPSDWRSRLNERSRLRRFGLKI